MADEPRPSDLAGRIIHAMRKHRYKVDDGEGEVNIVYIEGANEDGSPNDDAPNSFNDRRIVIVFEGGSPKIIGNWEATTEPGRRFTVSPINAKGAARIAFGQYTAWQVGMHRNNHEALVQTGAEVPVCRDLNKDYQREGDKVDVGWFGINQHWGYDNPEDDIKTASAGCLVGRTTKGHQQFMKIVKRDPRYLANRRFIFTSTVMPVSDIQ